MYYKGIRDFKNVSKIQMTCENQKCEHFDYENDGNVRANSYQAETRG